MKLFLPILLFAFSASAQTNYVQSPDGTSLDATTPFGFFWQGFMVGLSFYVFGMILKMSKRVVTGNYD